MSNAKEIMYPENKAKDELLINPYMYYVLRPLSFTPSILLYRLGVSAYACTVMSAAVLFSGIVFLLGGAYLGAFEIGLVLGALFINIYYYMDVLDGNIARLAGSSSNLGAFLDETLNSIAGVLVPCVVGLGIFLARGDAMSEYLDLPLYSWIVLGFGIALFRLFRRLVTNHVAILLGEVGDRTNVLGENRRSLKYWASVVNSVAFVSLFVASVVQAASLWLLVYFGFNLAVVVYTLIWAYRRLSVISQ